MLSFSQVLAYPPLDGSLLLHEIPDFNSYHNPLHPCFVYSGDNEQVCSITHLEFARGVHRVAHAVHHLPLASAVGVLALTDTLLYHAVFFGLMKAGHVVSLHILVFLFCSL